MDNNTQQNTMQQMDTPIGQQPSIGQQPPIGQQSLITPKKENNKTLLIIICSAIGALLIILILVLVLKFTGNNKTDNPVVGSWGCTRYLYGTSSLRDNPSVMMKLNEDGTFVYGEYGDLDNNHFAGTYTATLEDKDANSDVDEYYKLTFGPTQEYVMDGKSESVEGRQMSDMEIGIKDYGSFKEATLIATAGYLTYICKTE